MLLSLNRTTSLFGTGTRSSNTRAALNSFLLSSSSSLPLPSSSASDNDATRKGHCNVHVIAVRPYCKTTKVYQEGPVDYGYTSPDDSRFSNNCPTIKYAQMMPHGFSGMRHEQILQLCVEGSYSARKEAMTRNVMGSDSIEYEEATKVVTKIIADNREGFKRLYLPYKIGLGASLFGAGVSFPMIFHLETVVAFNERFVTVELPEMKDMETFLEVGSTSWSWMEPIIGQISFVLLALQFARNQALNLGVKPYGNWVTKSRADRLVAMYPQYDEVFVRWISEAESLHGSKTMK